jgi:hypothetical protein
MKRGIAWFFVSFFITLTLAFGLLSVRSYQVVEGVLGLKLVRRCELFFFSPPAQPISAIAFACPRMDLVRLWPLPIITPWSEDWWEDFRPNDVHGSTTNPKNYVVSLGTLRVIL